MKDFFSHNPGLGHSLDGLKIISRCPVCQTEHNPLETAVLDEAGGSHLIYIKCRLCHSGVVVSLTPTSFGLTSIGLVTDLSGNEIMRFKDAGRVTASDVLSIDEYFQAPNSF